MNSAEANAVLNRISAVYQRSLPMYLNYAPPWIEGNQPEVAATLAEIAHEQRATVRRLGELIVANNGDVQSTQFPSAYPALNDLGIDFLKGRLVQLQQRDIAEIEDCEGRLESNPAAEAAAKGALTAARRHLEMLQGLPVPSLDA